MTGRRTAHGDPLRTLGHFSILATASGVCPRRPSRRSCSRPWLPASPALAARHRRDARADTMHFRDEASIIFALRGNGSCDVDCPSR